MGQAPTRQRAVRRLRSAARHTVLSAQSESGAMSTVGAFPSATREAEYMYIGGGLVGTVVIVLLILFLMGRI